MNKENNQPNKKPNMKAPQTPDAKQNQKGSLPETSSLLTNSSIQFNSGLATPDQNESIEKVKSVSFKRQTNSKKPCVSRLKSVTSALNYSDNLQTNFFVSQMEEVLLDNTNQSFINNCDIDLNIEQHVIEENLEEITKNTKFSKYTNKYSGDDFFFDDTSSSLQSILLPDVYYALKCDKCDEDVESYTKIGMKKTSMICVVFWFLLIWTGIGAIMLCFVCKDKHSYQMNHYCPKCDKKIGNNLDEKVIIRGIGNYL